MTGLVGSTDLREQVDVLIAGGGPSGLFLALDLASRGIDSVILEPRRELDWTRPRAKTTNARTMTHLRRLGLAERLRNAAPLKVDYSDSVVFCTSLVGHELLRFRHAFQLDSDRYLLQPECGQQVPQPTVEMVLRHAADAEPRTALHVGVAYLSSARTEAGRVVAVQDEGGGIREIGCRFLIGADGLSSTVRRDLGLALEGSSAAKANLGVVFRSAELGHQVVLDAAVQYWVIGNIYAGMVGRLDLDSLWWCIVPGYDPQAPKFRDVSTSDVLRELVGVDVDIEVIAEDPWTARMLLARRYRSDGVFLVGDAAHTNPPWGGHGFNTCIGDAANLAWKLAATLNGGAGPELLASYEAERRPVARRTIDEAATNGSVLADDLIDDVINDLSEPGHRSRRRAAQLLTAKESEFSSLGLVLGYHYGASPLVTPSGGEPPQADPIHYQPSAAPGCLLPHAWVDDTTSLYDVLSSGFAVLIDGDALDAPSRAELAEVVSLAETQGITLTITFLSGGEGVSRTASYRDVWQAPMVLVRPDQHVAWRGSDPSELPSALLRRLAGERAVNRFRSRHRRRFRSDLDGRRARSCSAR